MHVAALGFPDYPSPETVAAYKQFYENFGNILPCKKCSINYAGHLIELPLEDALSSRDKLFAWTVKLHNIVNKETSKPQWTVDYAREFYLSGAYNDCLLSYNTQTVRTDVWRMILICMIILNIVIIIYALFVLLKM